MNKSYIVGIAASILILAGCSEERSYRPRWENTLPEQNEKKTSSRAVSASSASTSRTSSAGGVVDYFTGKTALEVKKRQENKLEFINDEHNRKLSDEL